MRIVTLLIIVLYCFEAIAQKPNHAQSKQVETDTFLSTNHSVKFSLSAPVFIKLESIKRTGIEYEMNQDNHLELNTEFTAILSEKLKRKSELESKIKAPDKGDLATQIKTEVHTIGVGGCAPDNTIAVSDSGHIVAITNRSILFCRDHENVFTLREEYLLSDFFAGLPDSISRHVFDPRVVYDPEANRFIFSLACTDTLPGSFLVLAVSQTEDPLDGWIVYSTSIHRDLGGYLDYPGLAVNNKEVFVTGDILGGDKRRNLLLQIEKEDLYNGSSGPRGLMWFDLFAEDDTKRCYSLYPVQSAIREHYGPELYIVSTRSGGGDKFYLFTLTDALGENTLIIRETFSTSHYYSPLDVAQKNTEIMLDLRRNCKVRSAFYLAGRISFSFTSTSEAGVYNGLSFYRLRLRDSTFKRKFFHNEGLSDYVYPAICHAAQNKLNFKTCMIFMQSSSNHFPSVRAQINKGRTLSREAHSSLIVRGQYFKRNCNDLHPLESRWGDYISIHRKYGSRHAWAFAHTANENNRWQSHLVKVHF